MLKVVYRVQEAAYYFEALENVACTRRVVHAELDNFCVWQQCWHIFCKYLLEIPSKTLQKCLVDQTIVAYFPPLQVPCLHPHDTLHVDAAKEPVRS